MVWKGERSWLRQVSLWPLVEVVLRPGGQSSQAALSINVPPAVHVPEGAFAGVPRLRHVSVESGIRLIGISDAFCDCKLLNSVLAPGCRDFGHKAFAECCSLQWVHASEGIPNVFNREAKFGQYLFQG